MSVIFVLAPVQLEGFSYRGQYCIRQMEILPRWLLESGERWFAPNANARLMSLALKEASVNPVLDAQRLEDEGVYKIFIHCRKIGCKSILIKSRNGSITRFFKKPIPGQCESVRVVDFSCAGCGNYYDIILYHDTVTLVPCRPTEENGDIA